MPTPTRTFHDIAARFGKVDPNDPEAVRHWFTEVLPTLPPDTIEEILEALLGEDAATDDKPTPRSYPQGVPLPSLSASPAAPIPLLAAGWKDLLNKLARRRTKG
jgi:hypothetical protein